MSGRMVRGRQGEGEQDRGRSTMGCLVVAVGECERVPQPADALHHTNALSVDAISLNLPGAVGATIAQAASSTPRPQPNPICVLGAAATEEASEPVSVDIYERAWAT